jgi:glycosyltransferase involved in cell wall biosynthesis
MQKPLRIFLHDYTGHPPQVHLSRALARRGHTVLHAYSTMFQTPKGNLQRNAGDAKTFDIAGIGIGEPFQKHSYVKRQLQEIKYGKALVRVAADFRPDLVIGSNTPLFPLNTLRRFGASHSIPFVFWMMDVYGLAVRDGLAKKSRLAGKLIGGAYIEFEKYICRHSDKIIVIAEDFQDLLLKWPVPADKIDCLPLWAPLEDMPLRPKENAWSRANGLAVTTNLIYAGTLGLKHNPQSLVTLAQACKGREKARVIVISEGIGANYLKEQKNLLKLDNLMILPFQPFEELPNIFGAADVLLALLEPEAGVFSVPGKVLSHLCAGRPQVALVPAENRATRVIRESGGGFAVPCGNVDGFVGAVCELIEDPVRRSEMGAKARSYAEREFDIDSIAASFERMILKPFNSNKKFH